MNCLSVERAAEENLLPREVDLLDLGISKLGAAINRAERIEDIARLDFSGQYGGDDPVEAGEIVAIDDRQANAVLRG